MSAEAWAIAMRHTRTRNPRTKLVLLGIANHDGDGGAWPSVATLAEYALCDPRTVQRAVDELEELHEIRRVVQGGGTRWTADHRRPNLYEFLLRCPPDCDGSKNHRTRRTPPLVVELDGLEPLYPQVEKLSTRVTPVSPVPVTPVSPEPVLGTGDNTHVDNQPSARAREGWTRLCIDGSHLGHQLSRKTGRCAFCGATRTHWEEIDE